MGNGCPTCTYGHISWCFAACGNTMVYTCSSPRGNGIGHAQEVHAGWPGVPWARCLLSGLGGRACCLALLLASHSCKVQHRRCDSTWVSLSIGYLHALLCLLLKAGKYQKRTNATAFGRPGHCSSTYTCLTRARRGSLVSRRTKRRRINVLRPGAAASSRSFHCDSIWVFAW